MKITGAVVLVIGVLLAAPITCIWATSEPIHERKLMVAIDDGTEDGQLFIEMDDSDAAMAPDDSQLGEPRSPIDATQNLRIEQTNNHGGVTIISGSTIDDKTRNRIRSILSSSGHSGKVIFLSDHEATGYLDENHDAAKANALHRTKVVSKEISATN